MRVQQQNRPMHAPRLPYQWVKLDITMKLLRGLPWSTEGHRGVHDASGSNPGVDYKTVSQHPTLTRGVSTKIRTSQ